MAKKVSPSSKRGAFIPFILLTVVRTEGYDWIIVGLKVKLAKRTMSYNYYK